MHNLFGQNSPVIRWLNLIGKIVILSTLWLICCIPIITIGASTTALYRVSMKLAGQKDDISVFHDFLQAFRANFKPATIVWLILLIPTLLILLNLVLLLLGELGTTMFAYLVCLIPVPPLLFILAYVFAYIATFEDRAMVTITNSAILSISNFPKSLLMVAINLIPLVVFLISADVFLRLLFIWLLLVPGLIAYINSKLILRAFQPYLLKKSKAAVKSLTP